MIHQIVGIDIAFVRFSFSVNRPHTLISVFSHNQGSYFWTSSSLICLMRLITCRVIILLSQLQSKQTPQKKVKQVKKCGPRVIRRTKRHCKQLNQGRIHDTPYRRATLHEGKSNYVFPKFAQFLMELQKFYCVDLQLLISIIKSHKSNQV